jgi:hypothetical protein
VTIRAVILGLLGAIALAGFGYINDNYMRLTMLVGNHLPISVFGVLIVLAMVVNPLLYLVRWRLKSAELGVITGMLLIAAAIPGSGLMRTFTTTLILPIQSNRANPGWQSRHVLDYAPPSFLVNDGRYDPRVVDGFNTGLSTANQNIGVGDVPWWAWARPLSTWLPIILLVSLSSICLGLIVHHQWSVRERLRYPIAAFATSLMEQDPDRAVGSIFRNRLFWIGFGAVFLLHLVNGAQAWYPESIHIDTNWMLNPVFQKWKLLQKTGGDGWWLINITLYPTVIAFGFLLASEVSFSLGISQLLIVLVTGALLSLGIDTNFDHMRGGTISFQRYGSAIGIVMLLLYTGRRYYWQLAKEAITFIPQQETQPYAVWAFRVLIASVAGTVIILSSLGLPWPIALFAVTTILVLYLVIARINAETGAFFVQPWWQPVGIAYGLFGMSALGPGAVAILALLTAVLTVDPRECLLPFFVNALKIGEGQKVKPARVGPLSAVVFMVALAVAVPVAIYCNYNNGIGKFDGWTKGVPDMAFNMVDMTATEMAASDSLAESAAFTPLQRLTHMNPDTKFVWGAGIGLALALIFSALRLRFTWWPLHPILLLVWGTYPMWCFAPSFLFGWFIKAMVTRFGGTRAYRMATAFMFGAIAGDLLGGLLFMGIGAAYYLIKEGAAPKPYSVFPL